MTIVEFSDFQCPYCKLSVPLIKEILVKYPDKVKVAYRDYPGPNHPHAPQAAEAAQYAGGVDSATPAQPVMDAAWDGERDRLVDQAVIVRRYGVSAWPISELFCQHSRI